MNNFLQLWVKLLVCGYYGAFWTHSVLDSYEDTCNSTLDHRLKAHEKDFPIHFVLSFLQWKLFLPKSVFFAFCFLPDALYIDVEPKLMMSDAVNDVCMLTFCFHESLVIISVWWEWVGDRNFLGDIWKYRLENVAIAWEWTWRQF